MTFELLLFLAVCIISLCLVPFVLVFCCILVVFLQSPGTVEASVSSVDESSAEQRAHEDFWADFWASFFCTVSTEALICLGEERKKGTGTAVKATGPKKRLRKKISCRWRQVKALGRNGKAAAPNGCGERRLICRASGKED